jgi:prepilin-type N-terminal cleavage/methylation domain-containing protein
VHQEDHQQRLNHSGFTLLELLVVIGLLAVLSLTLMGSLRLGGRVWEHTASARAPSDDLRLTAQFLTNSLSNAYPLLDRSDSLHPMLRFSGDAKAVRYLAPLPQVLGAAGPGQMLGKTPYDKLMGAVNRSMVLGKPMGATDWEIGQLYQGGRLRDVNLFEGGQPVSNPFAN